MTQPSQATSQHSVSHFISPTFYFYIDMTEERAFAHLSESKKDAVCTQVYKYNAFDDTAKTTVNEWVQNNWKRVVVLACDEILCPSDRGQESESQSWETVEIRVVHRKHFNEPFSTFFSAEFLTRFFNEPAQEKEDKYEVQSQKSQLSQVF